jgi:hypothetical protein
MARLCLSMSGRNSLWSGECQQNHLITKSLIMRALLDPCQYCNCTSIIATMRYTEKPVDWLPDCSNRWYRICCFQWSEILLLVHVFEWLFGELVRWFGFWWVDFLTDWSVVLIISGWFDWLAGWITMFFIGDGFYALWIVYLLVVGSIIGELINGVCCWYFRLQTGHLFELLVGLLFIVSLVGCINFWCREENG